MARYWAIATIESAYGTAKTTPVLGTEYFPIRMTDGNAVKLDKKPIIQRFSTFDVGSRAAMQLSGRSAVSGRILMLAYVSQMPYFLPWALTPINAGQTSPWTTSLRPGDLASMTIDVAEEDAADGTVKKRRFTGCKVKSGRFSFDNQSDVGVLDLQIIGKDETTHTQTEPALSAYPTSAYLFQDLTTFKIGGASLTDGYASFSISWTNNLVPAYYAKAVLTSCRNWGRSINGELKLLYQDGTDYRLALNSLTAQDNEFVWTRGVNTMKLDFHTNNGLDDIDPDRPLAAEFEEMMKFTAMVDAAQGTELALTFT